MRITLKPDSCANNGETQYPPLLNCTPPNYVCPVFYVHGTQFSSGTERPNRPCLPVAPLYSRY